MKSFPIISSSMLCSSDRRHHLCTTDIELHCRGKQVIKDIASGLFTLHEGSICHLDIKSPNVLLTSERRGKIADFGLGKMLNGVPANTLSQIGTPPWTCPELLLKGRYSVKSDVWSLSTIIIEVSDLKGNPPVLCELTRKCCKPLQFGV